MDIAPLNQKTGYVRWMKAKGCPFTRATAWPICARLK
jgi:hypothetical protein